MMVRMAAVVAALPIMLHILTARAHEGQQFIGNMCILWFMIKLEPGRLWRLTTLAARQHQLYPLAF